MEIITQQLIGSFILGGTVAGMLFNLIDLKREERKAQEVSPAVQVRAASSPPVYLKECGYIYPSEQKAKAV